MSDLLAEVDEAMRQERLSKFWHENGALIIAFVVLTIVSTGAFSAYRSWDTKTKTKQTQEIIALTDAEDYPANVIDAELNIRPSLRGIALLSAAGTFMEQDKPEEAAKLYARLAADKKIPNDFNHLGIIMDARLKLDSDTPDLPAILASLSPVINGKSPWKPHAQIDAAIINAQFPDGNAQALALLNAVSDTPNLPQSIYERAEKLHHVFSQNQASTEAKTQ